MTCLEKLAREIKNMADKQEHFYIGSPARISALMDVVLKGLESLEQIQAQKGMTNLGECCVNKTCSPVYEDGEKVAHCAFQWGVLRGFNECASRADEALAYAEERLREV